MLYIAIVVSLIQLVVVHQIMRWPDDPPRLTAIACCVGCAVLPLCLMLQLTAVMLQSLLLVVGVLLWPKLKRVCPSFLLLSVCLTLAAYGVAAGMAWESVSALVDKFPYESMEARLPTPRSSWRPRPRLSARKKFVRDLEMMGAAIEDYSTPTHRNRDLELLHEHTLRLFIDSPGFGVARMRTVTEWTLTLGLRSGGPVEQPTSGPVPDWSPGLASEPPCTDNSKLEAMHRDSVVDFVNAAGFGFVKDRRHAAGFQAHQFSQVPDPAESWTVARLDLIGLVLHDPPVAYVSANLPRMDELRDARTRSLDGFEAFGLSALREGQEVFVRPVPDALRMLGAIWSTEQCIGCHGGERGDLLGAFSYTLLRRPQ